MYTIGLSSFLVFLLKKIDKYTKSKNVILASLKCSIFQENITKF